MTQGHRYLRAASYIPVVDGIEQIKGGMFPDGKDIMRGVLM